MQTFKIKLYSIVNSLTKVLHGVCKDFTKLISQKRPNWNNCAHFAKRMKTGINTQKYVENNVTLMTKVENIDSTNF